MYADSMAFLAPPGKPPILNPQARPAVSLVHSTSAPPTVKTFNETLAAHKAFKATALANEGAVHIRTKGDLHIPHSGIGMLFGLQHAPEDIEREEQVRELAEEGVQFMALSYNEAGRYGAGCLANGGLKEEGKRLIRWMAKCGIALDVSHANSTTAEEALQFIQEEHIRMFPLASHSGVHMVFSHPRNLSEHALYLLGAMRGYLGLPMITFFICLQEHLGSYARKFGYHMTVAKIICGADHVGVGSDCFYGAMTMGEAQTEYERMVTMLKTDGQFGEYFPDRPEEVITNGRHTMSIARRMLALDKTHGAEALRGFCGENFAQYLKRVLPE